MDNVIELPKGYEIKNKWVNGQPVRKGQFAVLLIDLEPETVTGKDKDGNAYSYERIANVTDGRSGMFAGGKVYGQTDAGQRVTFKTIGKIMPQVAEKQSNNATNSIAL
jgi:hypothetical protein